MVVTKRVPEVGFETDYARFVALRETVEEEVKKEFEKVLAERTQKLDQLIDLTSKVVEEEIPDEPAVEQEQGFEPEVETAQSAQDFFVKAGTIVG